ncbi:THO complex subunit 7 isoform X1 [Tachypleus tridentatus]|uniref:THO complex subunit 7 isoform X1 n=2 Tax=Tachypleus tridentatus TaxID=6853 RepID=UPI003FCF9060
MSLQAQNNQLQITDEEIIRRKLLVDGDGMGDDLRINRALKTFLKWCFSKDESEDQSTLTYERILMLLIQCEFAMVKSHQVLAMNQSEMENYEHLYQQIENRITEAQKKIQDCKAELMEAKQLRKNKQEYDSLAKVIEKQPDRKETLAKLQQVQTEIEKLIKAREDLDRKLEKRRKQFQVLLSAVFELEHFALGRGGEDKEEEEWEMTKEDMETS